MTDTELHLAYLSSAADQSQFDVKVEETCEFSGTEFYFHIIGDSHYIMCPALDFYELFSCHPIDEEFVETISIVDANEATEHHVRYMTDAVTVETTVEIQPLSAFPAPDTFDITYQFAERAYTTISCLSETTYETYHTYPEFETAVHTQNTLTSNPEIMLNDEKRMHSCSSI